MFVKVYGKNGYILFNVYHLKLEHYCKPAKSEDDVELGISYKTQLKHMRIIALEWIKLIAELVLERHIQVLGNHLKS